MMCYKPKHIICCHFSEALISNSLLLGVLKQPISAAIEHLFVKLVCLHTVHFLTDFRIWCKLLMKYFIYLCIIGWYSLGCLYWTLLTGIYDMRLTAGLRCQAHLTRPFTTPVGAETWLTHSLWSKQIPFSRTSVLTSVNRLVALNSSLITPAERHSQALLEC